MFLSPVRFASAMPLHEDDAEGDQERAASPRNQLASVAAGKPPECQRGKADGADVGHRENDVDDRAKDKELGPDGHRGGGIDELRQERHEEQRGLRIENLDDDAVAQDARL